MSTTPSQQTPESGAAPGHPTGLLVLAGTQLWERLSFYGLQAILAYYVYYGAADAGLGLPQNIALGVVGAYGGSVYLAEPLGAWLADRVVAARYVAAAGAALIMIGHVVLALGSGVPGLVLGLGFIVVGTGLLFPNIRTMVGGLYRGQPLKQDAGFAIFYGAIMVGALVGPLITGFLQTRIGFHAAFAAAAFGMAIGLAVYVVGWRTQPDSSAVVPNPLGAAARRRLLIGVPVLVLVVAIAVRYVVTLENLAATILTAIVVVALAYFVVILTSSQITAAERRRVVAFIPIFVSGVVFWALVLQLFTTFAIYADSRVAMRIASFDVPPAYISTFEVIAGILLSPLVAGLWQRLGRRQPSTPAKMAIGLTIMGAAYALFGALPLFFSGAISIWPVIAGMMVFGAAEITYAPVLYSVATQAAPAAFNTQMMALQGLSMAAGASVSGYVGEWFTAAPSESVFFAASAGVAVATALLLVGCIPMFKRVGLSLVDAGARG